MDLSNKGVASSPNVLLIMIRSGWFDENAWAGADYACSVLSKVHPDYEAIIQNVPALMKVDFSSLRMPR